MTHTKRERDKKIFDLWLQYYSQEEIANKLNIGQATVSETIKSFIENCQMAKIDNPHDFTPQLYDV